MSTQSYRDQVTRLVSELAGLETKLAKARGDAARERSAAGRAATSISRTSSPSTVQSRLREAERHESRAVALDKEAARLATLIASKQKARSDAERHLADAEAADRKKLISEADRRRRDDLRHIGNLERVRRPTRLAGSPWPFATPGTAELFWTAYREAVARVKPPHTYDAVAPHFERRDGTVGTEPDYLRKLVGRFGLPPDAVAE